MLMVIELINCFLVNESYLVIQQVTEHELFSSHFFRTFPEIHKKPYQPITNLNHLHLKLLSIILLPKYCEHLSIYLPTFTVCTTNIYDIYHTISYAARRKKPKQHCNLERSI